MEIFIDIAPLTLLFSAYLLASLGSLNALEKTLLLTGTFFLLAVFFALIGNYFMAVFELILTLLTVWVYHKSQEQLRKLQAENTRLKKKLEEELQAFDPAVLWKYDFDKIKQN